MLGLFMAFYIVVSLCSGLSQIEDERNYQACTVIVKKSCVLTLQLNQTRLSAIDDTCNIFENDTVKTAWPGKTNSLLLHSDHSAKFLIACFQNLRMNVSSLIKNLEWNKQNKSLSVRQHKSSENVQNNCDYPLLEISERVITSAQKIPDNSSNKLSSKRKPRHTSDIVKRNRGKKTRRCKRALKVLRKKRCCMQRVLDRKHPKACKERSTFVQMCHLIRNLKRHCLKVDKKRRVRIGIENNKTELDQWSRTRRSVSSNEWSKSLQFCQIDDLGGSLALNVLSKNVSNQKFSDGIFSIAGGQGVVKFNVKWYQSSGNGLKRIVFQFTVPKSLASTNLKLGATLTAESAIDNVSKRSGVSNIVVCVFSITALIAIVSACGYCAKNRYKTMQSSRCGRNLGSGDTYSERSSFDDSHEMELLGQVHSSTNDPHFTKDNCRFYSNQQRVNNNMPVSQSSISIDRQGSKRSSRKKNRHSIENSSASGTVVEQSKLKSPERQYFEPFSSLTGSSSRTTNSFNDKFNRRFSNNPQRHISVQSSLRQYSHLNFPPPVRRYPSRQTDYEITKSANQLNSDPNRFQTPPNRQLLKNDGTQIISVFEDRLCIQREPGSANSAPPICSPLAKSSNSESAVFKPRLNINANFAARSYGNEPPPEYSEPPSYYA